MEMQLIEQRILRKHLSKFLIEEVFNTITEDDILKQVGDQWSYKGQILTEAERKALQSQAASFMKSKLYEILMNELKRVASDSIIKNSKTEEDLIAGKMLMYLTDVVDSKLKKMSA